MKIAIEGCAHGELERIYDTIALIEQQQNIKVDLLLCCGDFQATRNQNDLECMAVPKKFQDICTFYKYYSGEKVAPILTIFIGGNHEASNYLQELPYGGWVAPNIYYLGYAGVVTYKGIRIGGLSGIYKGFDYFKGHFEKPPYTADTMRSVYHYRQQETFRLQQLSQPIDIIMSHDWPTDVYNYGNTAQLIKFKPHFRDEIYDNKLGSRPLFDLLKKIQPTYWFSGHLHCKFSAVIPHDNGSDTKFLALDKCLPNRRFLQVIDVETTHTESDRLQYDLEWLTILYTTKHLTHVNSTPNYMPGPGNTTCRWNFQPTDEEKSLVLSRFCGNLNIPMNFQRTAQPYNPNNRPPMTQQPKPVRNPQTIEFCNILEIDDPLNLAVILAGGEINVSDYRDVANASITSDTSLTLNDSDRLDDLSENNTLNSSTASSGGITNLTLLNQRLSLFDSLPAPKNSLNELLNPEEADIDLSDDDDANDSVDAVQIDTDIIIEEDRLTKIDDSHVEDNELSGIDEQIDTVMTTEKRQINDENQTESTQPSVKKIKRRNAAIYTETED
ncbi:lariat debranching enzyme [Contarinia nasturtii]|uniref:lariat debranching enzyme n=1 Tax=Contarinia nasturtii TaxID=265458 RepID=UPI0012D48467|nr:lariat debranching enzyme [Contarinia nasturtii]